jgi:hypothetical protein
MITKPHKRTLGVLFSLRSEIDKVLRDLYGKSIWNPSQLDCCRLVRLKIWSERYSVSIAYILSVLLPFHWHNIPKSIRSKAKNSKGLGVRISTLVGNASLSHLKEKLKEDFPEGENVSQFKESEKDRIEALLEENVPARVKGVLRHKSISAFVKNYRLRMIRVNDKEKKFSRKMKKMPFRGNPWT